MKAHPNERENGENEVGDPVFHVMRAVYAERGQEAGNSGKTEDRQHEKNDAEGEREIFQEITPFKASSKQTAPKARQYQPNGRKSLCLK